MHSKYGHSAKLVTIFQAGVDTGPVLVQERVAILENDTLESLSDRIHQAEHRAYPRALRLLAGGRVRLGPDNRLLTVY